MAKIDIRLADPELKRLDAWINRNKASQKRLTRSSLVRSLLRFFLGQDGVFFKEDVEAFRQTNRLLANLGSNLNQLAKAYHRGLIVTPVNVGPTFEELARLVNETHAHQKDLVSHITQKQQALIVDCLGSVDPKER